MPDQQQALSALASANRIRAARKALKAKLRRREILLDDVLEREPPAFIHTMRVADLIAAARGFGPKKAERIMKRLKWGLSRKVGSLDNEQRRELLNTLAKHNPQALYGAAFRDYIC